MPEEQSRPLSPFKTYREFVATQRDDADPQTFSRRYQDYRGTFARELVRRFFDATADRFTSLCRAFCPTIVRRLASKATNE